MSEASKKKQKQTYYIYILTYKFGSGRVAETRRVCSMFLKVVFSVSPGDELRQRPPYQLLWYGYEKLMEETSFKKKIC